MSFPALATAIQIAAASVPAGGPPVPVAAFDIEIASLDQSSQADLSTAPPVEAPSSAAPSPTPDPAQATQPVQSAEPASSPGPATETPNPPGRPDEIIVTGRGKSAEDPLQQLNAD